MTGRKNKFNAIRVELDGHSFDSKAEAARFAELKLLERAKEINGLLVHPVFTLRVEDSVICHYEADFEYTENEKWIVEDVKSPATLTPSSRIKMRLFKALFPTAELRITGLDRKRARRHGG